MINIDICVHLGNGHHGQDVNMSIIPKTFLASILRGIQYSDFFPTIHNSLLGLLCFFLLRLIFLRLLIWSYYFSFSVVDVRDYMNRVLNVEWAFLTRNKSHLLVEYNYFYMLLDSICWCFVENFGICVHMKDWSIFSFL